MDLGFVVPAGRSAAATLAQQIAGQLDRGGHRAIIATVDPATPFGDSDGLSAAIGECEVLVSLGGDGTFLRVASLAHALDRKVLGVNFGRLGYLLEVDPEVLGEVVTAGLAEGFVAEDRTVLQVDAAGTCHVALNEAAVEKRVPGHMIRLSTKIDGIGFMDYAADGVLVATPTGSTAYNLSAGGPVLDPNLASMILTPVAPHLAVDRSVVLAERSAVEITVLDERGAAAVVDGRQVATLAQGSSVHITRHERPLRLVVHQGDGYVARLRSILAAGGPR